MPNECRSPAGVGPEALVVEAVGKRPATVVLLRDFAPAVRSPVTPSVEPPAGVEDLPSGRGPSDSASPRASSKGSGRTDEKLELPG